MNDEIRIYLESYDEATQERFLAIHRLICESTEAPIESRLWAKLPSFYVGEKFVRIIPFKDHINIEASALSEHRDELKIFKFTPKGMLQLYNGDPILIDVLMTVFRESLE